MPIKLETVHTGSSSPNSPAPLPPSSSSASTLLTSTVRQQSSGVNNNNNEEDNQQQQQQRRGQQFVSSGCEPSTTLAPPGEKRRRLRAHILVSSPDQSPCTAPVSAPLSTVAVVGGAGAEAVESHPAVVALSTLTPAYLTLAEGESVCDNSAAACFLTSQQHFIEQQQQHNQQQHAVTVVGDSLVQPFSSVNNNNNNNNAAQMAYSAVYAALNEGAVTMYAGDGSFYTNSTQHQPSVSQAQLLSAGAYMLQPGHRAAAAVTAAVAAAASSDPVVGVTGHQLVTAARGGQQTSDSVVSAAAAAAASNAADISGASATNTSSSPSSSSNNNTSGGGSGSVMAETFLMTSHGGGGGACLSSADVDHVNSSAATCVSPSTSYDANCVQWLNDNYEVAEGVSLPRSTLYSHYIRHCSDNNLDPINAASFGKLIRQVFYGLRTRRLGTRGNSKYHYYGIRVKPDSPLNKLTEPESLGGPQLRRCRGREELSVENTADLVQAQQYLGDYTNAVPSPAEVELNYSQQSLPLGLSDDDVASFVCLYREHCEMLLDSVVTLQFGSVEILWQQFWRSADAMDELLDDDPEKVIPKRLLYRLCEWTAVQEYVRRMDFQFYQNLVDVLIPDVLRAIPSQLTQSIRNFAKTLEPWLRSAMVGVPSAMMRVKTVAASALAQTLRRYTSLNHLAQAARAVLQNGGQIAQMLADLNRVDFANVQEQASWVCQCDDSLVQRLESEFKNTLQQQHSLEQWAEWLQGVVSAVLRPFDQRPEFAKAARQFLLKWSFYSSMVIRDLTLRSAASFGSFHLIRLLYDEYMFYLVEKRVARVTGHMPLAVIAERQSRHGSATTVRSESQDHIADLLLTGSSDCVLDSLCLDRHSQLEPDVKVARRG